MRSLKVALVGLLFVGASQAQDGQQFVLNNDAANFLPLDDTQTLTSGQDLSNLGGVNVLGTPNIMGADQNAMDTSNLGGMNVLGTPSLTGADQNAIDTSNLGGMNVAGTPDTNNGLQNVDLNALKSIPGVKVIDLSKKEQSEESSEKKNEAENKEKSEESSEKKNESEKSEEAENKEKSEESSEKNESESENKEKSEEAESEVTEISVGNKTIIANNTKYANGTQVNKLNITSPEHNATLVDTKKL